MPETKLIQQETTLNVEPTSEADTLFVPDSSISYPEKEVAPPTEQASSPLDNPVNVSDQASYKSLPAQEACEIELQAHEEQAATDMLTAQLSTDPESEAKPQPVPMTEVLPTSETQLPILEPSQAEETNPDNSPPGLTKEAPQEDSQNNPTSLHIDSEEDKVDAPQDPAPLLQEEESEKSTIDAPTSEVKIDSAVSDEQLAMEPKVAGIALEQSVKDDSCETSSFDGSNEHCINNFTAVEKTVNHTISEKAISSKPDDQVPEEGGLIEGLSVQVPSEDQVSTTDEAPIPVEVATEQNTAEIPELVSISAPAAEASSSLVHDEIPASPGLENTSPVVRLTENNELVTNDLLDNEDFKSRSGEDLVSNPEEKSLENTQVALELSEIELSPEVSSEVAVIQSIDQISSEYEQKNSVKGRSVTPISTATVEPATVDNLVTERITNESITEDLPSVEPEQISPVSEALTDKVSTNDSTEFTVEAIVDCTPAYDVEAIVKSDECCVETSPVPGPSEGSSEPLGGADKCSDLVSEAPAVIEPSTLGNIVLRSVEQKSEPPMEEGICDEASVEASFIAERVAVETFVAELVEEQPAENSSVDTEAAEKVPISAEPATQPSIEEPVKQGIMELESLVHASMETPVVIDTSSENSPLELSKAPESSELPFIEQDSPDSPTFSDAIQEVSVEVPTPTELKENSVQESVPNLVSDAPASATSVDGSIVKEETSITPETTSEPGTPGEPTLREPKSEEPNSDVAPAIEASTDSQNPNTDSVEVKSPSKAEGYKKILKGAFQMSIGALFRRRSLKIRGKENKIDGKLEVEVARASGNIQTSSEN
ncbi:hypothetical protein DSO57_1014946 [Entomophthora muscae]|uniref:Uncharacterized protein n=1 Tax=Entomophthora muscae TaxID=34485 RepID=A0ACC2TGN6_9FUNG|nr:hypothetical protein DSO57_1014946 [Entomophthora muscae]